MPLSPDFQFSQNNLQDYVDCPRRFQLRHIQKQRWPALQSEPVQEQERQMKLGSLFHQMVFQYQSGVPMEAIGSAAQEIDLSRWWHNYLEYMPSNLPTDRRPEFSLTTPFAGFRLIAKYDLLAIEPGQDFIILDWKTSRKRTPRAFLKERLQTRLYPFLLVIGGAWLNSGQPIEPEQIDMIYWFTDYPDLPELFHYNRMQFEEDRQEIYKLITQICSTADKDFFMTMKDRNCLYCSYRSLCGRGERAGDLSDEENEPDRLDDLTGFDFGSIGEIRF